MNYDQLLKQYPALEHNFGVLKGFVQARHHLWCERIGQVSNYEPDSNFPAVSDYKYTNLYRFLDRHSQYLIKDIINIFWNTWGDTQEVSEELLKAYFVRIYTFKILNKLDTWYEMPTYLRDGNNDVSEIKRWVDQEMIDERSPFSNAYLLGAPSHPYNSWSEQYFTALQSLIDEKAYLHLNSGQSLEEWFKLLNKYKGFGPFLSYQFAMDFCYASRKAHFFNDFVMAGPGAVRGVCYLLGQKSMNRNKVNEIIKCIYENQDKFGIKGVQYQGRTLFLQVSDVQNIFCEFSKYCKVVANMHIKNSPVMRKRKKFVPSNDNIADSFEIPYCWKKRIDYIAED